MPRQPIMAPVFAPLLGFLGGRAADAVILSFDEIEAIIRQPLAHTATAAIAVW